MTPREKLQLSYELAFHPPRLNQVWGRLRGKPGTPTIEADLAEALDDACRLHLALPESGRCPQRALERLAVYQARSRAYGMPVFVKSVRRRLGRPELAEATVQDRLVRDIALPVLGRSKRVAMRG